ncbi:MAG: hypothetical protein GY799_29470 [Desulfobulbaceae bacterium]|nr:hypothetical protein [Desulfobulbaceae bacterium]
MSEGEAWIALMEWAEDQERVTIFKDEGIWHLEWFNRKGGFVFISGPALIELVEETCK